MARRSASALDALAGAPWPVGVVAGFLVLLLGKVVAPAALAGSSSMLLNAYATAFAAGVVDPLIWVVARAHVRPPGTSTRFDRWRSLHCMSTRDRLEVPR